MAGHKFTTDLDPKTLYQIAFRLAQDTGYTVKAIEDGVFTARSGNALLSFVAAPIAAYCDFQVAVHTYPDGNELVLERNSPWLLGYLGVKVVKSHAEALFLNIRDEVVRSGGKVTKEKEF